MPDSAVPTVGDPAAMRDLAGQLTARADLLGTAPTPVTASLDDATFEGKAADRLRSSVFDVRTRVVDAAYRLERVAAQLLADADEVERQNNELAREAEAAAEAAEQAKADAAEEAKSDADGSETQPPGVPPAASAPTTVASTPGVEPASENGGDA